MATWNPCKTARRTTPATAMASFPRPHGQFVSARRHATHFRRLGRSKTVPQAADGNGISPKPFPNEDEVMTVDTLASVLQPRPSPYCANNNNGEGFVHPRDRVMLQALEFYSEESAGSRCGGAAAYSTQDLCIQLDKYAVRSGPRSNIYFDPKKVTAAIVTCGGLCPGLNDVVKNLVLQLTGYGVPDGNILGIRYGFSGFYELEHPPRNLTVNSVENIQLMGGTILGTSRGGSNMKKIVEALKMQGINMVFVVGGNGGNAGASAIAKECMAQDHKCAVVGIPKSIDNDILVIDKTFGFDTAVEEAERAILSAKVEAYSAKRGVGIVKLMGRQSGFIALHASMAAGEADICLIPEVKFRLERVLQYIDYLLEVKGHCVIVIAEGAGQDILQSSDEVGTDASGNPILADVGVWLRDEVKRHFKEAGRKPADVKYIDPSYMIRASKCISSDAIYCQVLAQGAVHGAFAGFTNMTVGLVNTHYVYLPTPVIIQAPRSVNPQGRMWNRMTASNGQPDFDSDEPLRSRRYLFHA